MCVIVLSLSVFSLCGCSITEKQCLILTSALKSNPSHLRELGLGGNKIKDAGLKILCDILKDSLCKLEKLGVRNIHRQGKVLWYLNKTMKSLFVSFLLMQARRL